MTEDSKPYMTDNWLDLNPWERLVRRTRDYHGRDVEPITDETIYEIYSAITRLGYIEREGRGRTVQRQIRDALGNDHTTETITRALYALIFRDEVLDAHVEWEGKQKAYIYWVDPGSDEPTEPVTVTVDVPTTAESIVAAFLERLRAAEQRAAELEILLEIAREQNRRAAEQIAELSHPDSAVMSEFLGVIQ